MDKNNKLTDSDFLILFECVSIPITNQNISVTFSDKKYELPGYLEKEITKRIESIKKHSKQKGFEFFDDKVARLDDWSLNKNNDYSNYLDYTFQKHLIIILLQ